MVNAKTLAEKLRNCPGKLVSICPGKLASICPGRLVSIFVLFFIWPAVFVNNSGPPMADAVLLAAIRLVDQQTWTLSDSHDPEVVARTAAHDISFFDGQVYSGVGPGASVIAAPFYLPLKPLLGLFDDDVVTNPRMAYYIQNSRQLDVPASSHFKSLYLLQVILTWLLIAPLSASFFVRLDRQLATRFDDPTRRLAIMIAIGVGSMMLFYTSMYSRQALAYLLVWHGLLSLMGPHPLGRASYIIVGCLFGAAFAIDYPSAILIGLTCLGVLWRLPRPQRLGTGTSLAFPIVIAMGAVALYHWACFDSPFSTPYHHRFWLTPAALAAQGVDLSAFQRGAAVGISFPDLAVMARLCFGFFKGLFVYSPILFLGFCGHIIGLRSKRRRPIHVFCLVLFAAYLAYNSTLGAAVPSHAQHFWGGLAVLWGPRYLFAVIPFLAWGLTALDWHTPLVRWSCYVALLVSCVINVGGTMFSHVMMHSPALGADLQSPLAYAARLLVERGPRLPLLDAYDVGAGVQLASLVALLLGTAALVRNITSTRTPRASR